MTSSLLFESVSIKSLKVRNENDLPHHITFEQFQKIYQELTGIDQILWGILWETGGRISAVLSIAWRDIDVNRKELKLLVQKKKNHTTIQIPLSNAMMNELRNYLIYAKPNSTDYVFKTDQYRREKSQSGRLTRIGAYNKIKNWGLKYIYLPIHPHMLRHGLAIYLLSQNVPLQVIAARLGHSNVFITQKAYLVITPGLQRQLTGHIPMR